MEPKAVWPKAGAPPPSGVGAPKAGAGEAEAPPNGELPKVGAAVVEAKVGKDEVVPKRFMPDEDP